MTNSAQPPVVGWLEPYEWQETPMNGDSDDECAPEDESDFDDEGVFTL